MEKDPEAVKDKGPEAQPSTPAASEHLPHDQRLVFRGPIRVSRPGRQIYSAAQKERAIRLLDMGVTCRHVAALMGPRCSSGTPIRWRQEAREFEEARRSMEHAASSNSTWADQTKPEVEHSSVSEEQSAEQN